MCSGSPEEAAPPRRSRGAQGFSGRSAVCGQAVDPRHPSPAPVGRRWAGEPRSGRTKSVMSHPAGRLVSPGPVARVRRGGGPGVDLVAFNSWRQEVNWSETGSTAGPTTER